MTVPTETFTPITLPRAKELTEAYLERYFADSFERASLLDPSFGNLWKSAEKLFRSGGKRIRPYVALLSYQAYAKTDDIAAIIPAAAAQEILHLAMLMHDDIIDRDQMRYGTANVSGQYESIYADRITGDRDRRHYADSAALLAGDLLLSDAYKLLADCLVDPAAVLTAQRVLNEAIFTVIGGELLDTEASFNDKALVRPLDIARFKTASYSFVSPLVMGAGLAGASESEIVKLTDIGLKLGTAYQLQDDMLGMFGQSEVTGKSSIGDLVENKYTYLIQIFYDKASDEQKRAYEAIAGKSDLEPEDYETAKRLLVDSGAQQTVAGYIDELCDELVHNIELLSIHASFKSSLAALLQLSIKRDK